MVNSGFAVHRESDLLISLCSSSLIRFSGTVSSSCSGFQAHWRHSNRSINLAKQCVWSIRVIPLGHTQKYRHAHTLKDNICCWFGCFSQQDVSKVADLFIFLRTIAVCLWVCMLCTNWFVKVSNIMACCLLDDGPVCASAYWLQCCQSQPNTVYKCVSTHTQVHRRWRVSNPNCTKERKRSNHTYVCPGSFTQYYYVCIVDTITVFPFLNIMVILTISTAQQAQFIYAHIQVRPYVHQQGSTAKYFQSLSFHSKHSIH